MTTKINAPIIKGVTEKHDEIVPISKIKFDKDKVEKNGKQIQ